MLVIPLRCDPKIWAVTVCPCTPLPGTMLLTTGGKGTIATTVKAILAEPPGVVTVIVRVFGVALAAITNRTLRLVSLPP